MCSNPSITNSLGSITTPTVYAIAYGNGYVYLGQSGGLQTLNVSDPAAIGDLGLLAGTSSVLNIVVNGNYAYAGSSSNGLYVIDITTPGTPTLLTTVAAPTIKGLRVVGNRAYGATGAGWVGV